MKHQSTQQLIQIDNTLKRIIKTIPLPEIDSTSDVFGDLVSCVVEQQIRYRAKGTMLKKLMDLLDKHSITPDTILALDEAAFAEKKLSNLKYQTLIRVATYWKTNQLAKQDWHALSDEEIRNELLQIKGIGNWTVDMILLYTLGRPDIFPADDYHLKKIMTTVYQLNAQAKLKAQMTDIAKEWQPYRSTAVLYLLEWKAYLKQNPGKDF